MVNNAKDCIRYISKESFVSQKIFNNIFFTTNETKPILKPDKPIYVGFSILDLSKSLMHEFHYKYIKSKFNANLLFIL